MSSTHPADLHPGAHVTIRAENGQRRSGVVAAVDGRAMKIQLHTGSRWLPGTAVTVTSEGSHRAEVLTLTSDRTLWLTYGELLAERDRRRARRMKVVIPVSWHTPTASGRGSTVDLSVSGAGIQGDIPEQDAAMLTIELPDGSSVRALAEVRASRRTGDATLQSVEFVALPPDDAEALSEFLKDA